MELLDTPKGTASLQRPAWTMVRWALSSIRHPVGYGAIRRRTFPATRAVLEGIQPRPLIEAEVPMTRSSDRRRDPMSRSLSLFLLILATATATLFGAGLGDECKLGSNVAPQYLCPVGTTCLQAIGKKYCSQAGKACGWPNSNGYNLGKNKVYNGRNYTCTTGGFKRAAGEKCSSGSSCSTGLCLQAIGNKYCSVPGMTCGWPDTTGSPIGAVKQHNGKAYHCTISGFEESTPPPPPPPAVQVRTLNAAEKQLISQVFGSSVDATQIRVTNTVGSSGRPWTTNSPPLYLINVGDAYSSLATNYKRLLIHEVAHVWQGQHGVPFMSNSAVHQLLSAIGNGGDVGQAYSYTTGKQWNKYNVEQQASLIEDWFADGAQKTSHLYPYIRDNVRRGQPNARTQFPRP